MKITAITLQQLAVPLRKPYHLSKEYGIFRTATPVILTMETDEGITGYGECDPWPLFTGDSAESVMTVLRCHLAPMLIGAEADNINGIHRLMDASIRGQHLAKSAVDMAVYDIFGKKYGMPVHKLLGGKRRDSMRCMWSIGGSTPEESAAEVLEAKEKGYFGCMIKVGGPDWRLDAERTKAVRAAVGNAFPLVADANQGWDLRTAQQYALAVRNCDLVFFEQPLQSWDAEGMAELRRRIPMPLSADEGVMSLIDARRLISLSAVDVFSIKVTKNGGIRSAKAICEYASANGVRLFFNSMIEEGITQAASLSIAATVTGPVEEIGHAFFSPLRLEGDISDYSRLIRVSDGAVDISDEPGLGITPDQDAISRFLIKTETVDGRVS